MARGPADAAVRYGVHQPPYASGWLLFVLEPPSANTLKASRVLPTAHPVELSPAGACEPVPRGAHKRGSCGTNGVSTSEQPRAAVASTGRRLHGPTPKVEPSK